MTVTFDPPEDTMARRLEDKIRTLVLAALPDPSDLRVMYRGDPYFVPTRLHPFAVVYLGDESVPTGERGYGVSTGITNLRYSGFVSIEVYFVDVRELVPNAERKAEVPTYRLATRLIQAAWQAVSGWSPNDDPVVSASGKEKTEELVVLGIRNGQRQRIDNISQRGSFDFNIFTTRQDW